VRQVSTTIFEPQLTQIGKRVHGFWMLETTDFRKFMSRELHDVCITDFDVRERVRVFAAKGLAPATAGS
jgi:hypothetical protein